ALIDLSQHTQAEELIRQSLGIARVVGDKADVAACLNQLSCATVRGTEQEERYAEESVSLYGELNDQYNQASAYLNLALIIADQGRFKDAHDYCLRCIELCRSIGNKSLLAFALMQTANHYYEWGQTEEAERTRSECLTLFRELNYRHGLKSEL